MALKIDYVVRETGRNLRRNVTLTVASIVTVAVSLALFGVALLLRQGVDNATKRWEGGIEFVIFMNPEASPEQLAAIEDDLLSSPEVNRVTFFDQDDAFREFQDLFAGTPEIIETVSPEVLPPSYRVVPAETNAALVEALAGQYEGKPGVREVVRASETIQTLEDITNVAKLAFFGAAGALLGAASLLIFNTIRMAMFARRREIEVMKLVGATNWFIRVPFMVEGLIQGVIGAGLAIGTVFGINELFDRWLSGGNNLQLLESFVVATADVWVVSIWLVAIGLIVGVVGSALAVTRFLDV